MQAVTNKININGERYESDTTLDIFSLLKYLGFKLNLVVIDYNGTILPKEFWSKTLLKNGDNVEILTIAGGG